MTVFDLPDAERRISELSELTSDPSFWSRPDAQKLTRELSELEEKRNLWNRIETELQDLEALAELLSESADVELESEFYRRAEELRTELEKGQLLLLLDEEYDDANAIVSIHPGAGGLEAQDWAEMLYRMYLRWAENKKYQVRVLDEQPDQEAGIKSVTFMVKGPYAYGYLKGERGVHRLVRISPYDAAKRRHTSFASVEVVPELPDNVEIEIRPEDLKIDTYRSSGAGGQYVNMTDSAVRITHLPTGIVVSCQDERSQHMNRAMAMQVLRGRLYARALQERQNQLESLQGEKRAIAWGSQIRSYTLQPFQLVKDHRSGCEIGNVQAVLDGDLDPLIMAYLRFYKTGKTVKENG